MFKKTTSSIKNSLITGIFVITPLGLTFVVLRAISNILMKTFNPVLNQLALPPYLDFIIALFLAFLILYLVGLFSKLYFVAKIIAYGERLLAKIPVVKFLYLTSKQVMDSLAIMQKKSLNKVVVVEYPRKGIRCLAFVTGETRRSEPEGEFFVNIFLPSTPNPTTGFFLMLLPEEVWDVNLTLEQATKMLISGGMLVPPEIKLWPYASLSGSKIENKKMSISNEKDNSK